MAASAFTRRPLFDFVIKLVFVGFLAASYQSILSQQYCMHCVSSSRSARCALTSTLHRYSSVLNYVSTAFVHSTFSSNTVIGYYNPHPASQCTFFIIQRMPVSSSLQDSLGSHRSRRHQAAAASHIHTDSNQSYLQWRRRLWQITMNELLQFKQNSFP